MFFRKKKYDLAGIDRDSTVSDDSNRISYTSSASSGYSSGSGETLSRKKELRRLSAMSQIYDGSSARSSSSSLNHFSAVPSPDLTPPETTRKQRICPVFEQGTPVKRTSSDSAGRTQEQFVTNGRSVVQSSTDICSQTRLVGLPQKVASSNYISVNSPQRHSFDNDQQQQQPKKEATQNNDMNFKQPPIDSFPTPGPTNIDDVMNSNQGLNSPPIILNPQASPNRSPVRVTKPIVSNSNNNNNNNCNIVTISETPSVSRSSFTLSDTNSSKSGQMEIQSLRQLRKLAPKSLTQPTIKDNFSRSTSTTTTTTTTTASTTSTSKDEATLATNSSVIEPVVDFVSATDKLELEPEKKRSITAINIISESSSENQHTLQQHTLLQHTPLQHTPLQYAPPQHTLLQHTPLQHTPLQHTPPQHTPPQHASPQHAPQQNTSPQHAPPQNTPPQHAPPQHASSATFSETLSSPGGSTNPQLEPEQFNEPRISYPDETDAITTPTTNTLSITEIVDYPNVLDDPRELQECESSMTTNIDEECRKDILNHQLTNGCLDNAEAKVEESSKATKIYIGSAFTNNQPGGDNNFLSGEENFKVDSTVYLQSNCVSRIIIKNDTIAITNAEDGNKNISSVTNVFSTSNQDSKLLPLRTVDVGKVQTDVGSELERNGDIRDEGRTTVTSFVEENHEGVGSNDIDPVLDNVNHSVDADAEVKDHHLPPLSPPPIIDDLPTHQSTQKKPATVGTFRLNAGSSNVAIKKPSNSHKSKSLKADDDEKDDDGEDDDDHEYFKRKKQETIEGRNGSFRGIRNLVKSGISTFVNKEESQFMKNLLEQSRGKIILFTTSMSVIRITRDRCSDIKKILQNHRVYFEERDVYISDENAKDLIQRFKIERLMSNSESKPNSDDSSECGDGHRRSGSGGNDYSKVEYEEMLTKLPRVFVEDFDLGDHEEVSKLNETGVLKKIFKEFPKVEGDITCPGCGGFRYTPCHSCHGSKRSRSNAFTEEFFALRCTKCDENGLARCKLCNSSVTSGE